MAAKWMDELEELEELKELEKEQAAMLQRKQFLVAVLEVLEGRIAELKAKQQVAR